MSEHDEWDEIEDDELLDLNGLDAEDAIALQALVQLHARDGADELDDALRDAFAAVAQEALALKERRRAREAALAEALEQERHEEAARWEQARAEEEERRLRATRDRAWRDRQVRAREARERQNAAETPLSNRERTSRAHRRAPASAVASETAPQSGRRPEPKPRRSTARRRAGDPSLRQPRPETERRSRARAEDQRMARRKAQAHANAAQEQAQRERRRHQPPRQAPRPSTKPRAMPGTMKIPDKATSRSTSARVPERPSVHPSTAIALTGSDLAAWRAHRGYNQQAAAKHLGVGQGTISKAERKGSKPLGPTLQRALASALASDAPAR